MCGGNRFVRRWCAVLVTVSTSVSAFAADPFVTADELAVSKRIADAMLSSKQPAFSFLYDGKPSAELLAQWGPQSQERALDDRRTQHTLSWKDPQGGLTVKMVGVRYSDAPAVEWTVYLRNDGTADSKLIENLRGIDAVIAKAPAAAAAGKARASWSLGTNFPAAASGERIELYRGWGGGWKPLAPAEAHDGIARFAAGGNAPWIAADPKHKAVLMMPAQGIEAAGPAETSGKSPAAAFVAPVDGIYRVSGTITKIGDGGDGVEWALQNFANYAYASGTLEDARVTTFDKPAFLRAGERVGVTMHSRSTTEGDLCRLAFNVTQLTDVVDGDVVVRSNKGSEALDTDYQPVAMGLAAGERIELASRGGRPSDWLTLPYFNVQTPSGGVVAAIGWPGQWDATFAREGGGGVRLAAGQEAVRLVLHPGEEIRTPLIALVAYAGADPQRGQNVWRRWMVDHNLPRVDGKLRGPFAAATSSHQTAEMIKANEANQIGYINGYFDNGLKIDYWWMDAGWYENDGTWPNTGTWKVDRKRFPNGLRAVSDHARGRGAQTIVWFEPERVTRPSELYNEHPDFLLTAIQDYSDPSSGLVSMAAAAGNPCVVFNPLDRPRYGGPLKWAPKQLTLHPGPGGEYAAVRFTAPADGEYQVTARFSAGDPNATTDVHVRHAGKSLMSDHINVSGRPAEAKFDGKVTARRGEAIDFVVGRGNGKYESDTTALAAAVTGPGGKKHDLASDFNINADTIGAWTFGVLPAGEQPDAAAFSAFSQRVVFGDSQGWKLLNHGNPAARQWITDRVDSIIKSEGINLYRQDFNIAPLNYWRNADREDRRGMTENLYVQGYLKYWDDLRARNPGLWIDSCASGGRRNDLETMRRAVPLTRSDRLFVPIGQQGHQYGISQWIPHSGNGVLIGKSNIFPDIDGKIDPYYFRSQMSATVILCADTMSKDIDYETFRRMLAEWRDISPHYLADYYPLTSHSLAPDAWIAWQYDTPANGTGMVQAFRRDDAADASRTLRLHGLDRSATYTVTNSDRPGAAAQKLTGAQLLDEGIELTIAEKPGAATLRYARH